MAKGDTNDMLSRLRALLPARWFPDTSPILDGLASGFASVAAHAYALLGYVSSQTRFATMSDGFLDIAAFDFLGLRVRRFTGEPDTAFSKRIRGEILRVRATRPGVIKSVSDLTGRQAFGFEAQYPPDCGGYSVASTMGYGTAGSYGSQLLPNQIFITAYRPVSSGVPAIAGYDSPPEGYGVGGLMSRAAYGSVLNITGVVTDADIYASVDNAMPAGCIAWVQILN